MPQDDSTIRKVLRAAMTGGLAAILIVAASGGHAIAADGDDDDELPDAKFFRSIMTGLGLKKDGAQSGFEYRERSPLVVPPTRDLPPPASDSAQGNAAWPLDQDAKRRKEAASKRKQEKIFDWSDLGRQLGPEEMRKAAATPKDEALRKRSAETPEAYQQQMKPDQLGYKGGLWDFNNFFRGNNEGEVGKFDSEPPRASLTDPPAGYRTPSSAQPYGLSKENVKSKPQDIYDRPAIGTGSTSR